MAVNKVTLGDETLIDLTNDTAEPEDVLEGAYFHTAAGVRTAGTRRNVVVDDELSPTSENPVQNKVIYNALQNIHIDVDDELSDSSENPVQNKVITQELTNQKSAIDDLTALTNRKAGMLVDTAFGAIASFVPDATVPNLLGVTVDVEPVQDLHGYDSPWPAGGGKNKYNSAETEWGSGILDDDGNPVATVASHYTLNFTAVKSGTNYILSGSVSSSNVQIRIYFYTESKTWISRTSGTSASTCAFSTPANCNFIRIQVDSAITSTSDWQVEEGSTATAFAPYSNICPISGWDSVEVDATGINIWDEEWESGTWNANGQKATASDAVRSKNFIPVKPETSYYVTFPTATYTRGLILRELDGDGAVVQSGTVLTLRIFTASASTRFIVFCSYRSDGVTTYNHDVSINYPSTDHDYHPFAGNVYTITLGQTVYGGTLDVTNGKVYARPFFPSYNGQTLIGPWISSMDVYTPGATPTVGAQVVDMGGAVTEITLDPVTISTISGQINNVWADAGDVAVEYAADLKWYIDSKISALAAQIVNS